MEKLDLIKKLWLITVISLVLVSSFYLTVVTNKNYLIRQRIILGGDQLSPNTLVVKAKYNLTVIRDGKIIAIRQKEDDPISIQWYRMIANMMFGFIKKEPVVWLDTGGNNRTWVDTEYSKGSEYAPSDKWSLIFNPTPYIALGSGSGVPSKYDYKLFNEVVKLTPDIDVVDDSVNNQYIVIYTKSFTIDQAFTLTEVGLELKVDVDPSGGQLFAYLLIAHDKVDPSVDLVQDDVVTITYTLTISYDPNGVFTRWFYNALITYWLGYKGLTKSSLTLKTESNTEGIIDTALDDWYSTTAINHGSYTDAVDGEKVVVEIGSGVSTTNPVFETYSLASRVKDIFIDDENFNAYVDEENEYRIRYVVGFSFTESSTIYEIGLSYYTDRADGHYNDDIYVYDAVADRYLWLYWKLPSAIQVDSGDGLRVEIEIVIPYV